MYCCLHAFQRGKNDIVKNNVIVCVYFKFLAVQFFFQFFFYFRIFFGLESENQEIKLVWPLTNLFVEQDLRNKNEKPLEKIEDKILKNPIDHFLEFQTKWTDYYIKPVYIFFYRPPQDVMKEVAVQVTKSVVIM